MYKFIIPLFILALLVGCTPKQNPLDNAYSSSSAMTDTSSASTASGAAMMQSDSSASTTPDTMTSSSANSVSPTGFNGDILKGLHTVVLKTSMGEVTLELNADKAPKTVTNFVALSKIGYYSGLTFHRVIPQFMIQGGDPSGNGTGGTSVFGDTFEDEPNDLQMVRGVIAMANRGPDTNGSQFFITVADTPWLQGRHTIFGHVTAGMDVVDKIANAARDASDKPLTPITFMPDVQN